MKRRFITLPTPFLLVGPQADEIIQSKEELLRLSKMEFFLLWIGEKVCEYPQLKVIEFSFVKKLL